MAAIYRTILVALVAGCRASVILQTSNRRVPYRIYIFLQFKTIVTGPVLNAWPSERGGKKPHVRVTRARKPPADNWRSPQVSL
ncbi:MAG: hypothetical protein PVF55_05445, partial [Desulfobacterales bacterium]